MAKDGESFRAPIRNFRHPDEVVIGTDGETSAMRTFKNNLSQQVKQILEEDALRN